MVRSRWSAPPRVGAGGGHEAGGGHGSARGRREDGLKAASGVGKATAAGRRRGAQSAPRQQELRQPAQIPFVGCWGRPAARAPVKAEPANMFPASSSPRGCRVTECPALGL